MRPPPNDRAIAIAGPLRVAGWLIGQGRAPIAPCRERAVQAPGLVAQELEPQDVNRLSCPRFYGPTESGQRTSMRPPASLHSPGFGSRKRKSPEGDVSGLSRCLILASSGQQEPVNTQKLCEVCPGACDRQHRIPLRLEFHTAKPPGGQPRRLCLVPHTYRARSHGNVRVSNR